MEPRGVPHERVGEAARAADVGAPLRVDVAGVGRERQRGDPHQRNRHPRRHHRLLVDRRRRVAAAVELERRRHPVAPVRALEEDGLGLGRERLGGHRELLRVLRHLAVLDGQQRLAGLAVEQEQVAVGAHRRHRLHRLAVDRRVVEQQRGGDVGVPDVVTHDLVVPAPLAGLHVEGEDRGGEQVVAVAQLAAEHRHRVAGREVDHAEVRVDGADEPHAAPAVLPRVAVLRPGLVAELAGPRDDVERPRHLAGRGVEGEHAPLAADVAVGEAHEHLAARDHRRGGHHLAPRPLLAADPGRPDELAGVAAEGDDLAAARAEEDAAVVQPHALPRGDAPRLGVRLPAPDGLAGPRVEREDVGAAGQVDHTVVDHRGRARRGAAGERRHPRAAESVDGVGRDRVEGRVARAEPVAAGEGPVRRRVAAARLGRLGGEAGREGADHNRRRDGDE